MQDNNNQFLKIIVVILLAVIGNLLLREVIGNNGSSNNESKDSMENTSKNPKNAVVSGNVVFTGLKPTSQEKGYIGIEFKKASEHS